MSQQNMSQPLIIISPQNSFDGNCCWERKKTCSIIYLQVPQRCFISKINKYTHFSSHNVAKKSPSSKSGSRSRGIKSPISTTESEQRSFISCNKWWSECWNSFYVSRKAQCRRRLPATHRSSCRSGPRPGTPPAPPEPGSSAGRRSRWCRRRRGSDSCSSSASPRSWCSPSARRSRLSSRRWGSRDGPGRSPAGSYCLQEDKQHWVVYRGVSISFLTLWKFIKVSL